MSKGEHNRARVKIKLTLRNRVTSSEVKLGLDSKKGVGTAFLNSIVGSNGTFVDDRKVLFGEVLGDTLDDNLGLGGLGLCRAKSSGLDRHSQKCRDYKVRKLHGDDKDRLD